MFMNHAFYSVGRWSNSLIVRTVLLLANCDFVFSRPVTPTGQPMALACPITETNSIPDAHWHTIKVVQPQGLPKIHGYQKFNPVWWLENADDPVPPAWYRSGDRHRDLKWSFRNPFHNFDHYVIGIADKSFRRSGKYPERNSNPHGGWDVEIARRKLAVLPFVSYERRCCSFYFGWREHGAFGIKLNFWRC